MEPQINKGSRVLFLYKYWTSFKKGDIVLIDYYYSNQKILCRIRKTAPEMFKKYSIFYNVNQNEKSQERIIPADMVYCEYDDNKIQNDSRILGLFKKSQIEAKVVHIFKDSE